jgi:hypothetical protein
VILLLQEMSTKGSSKLNTLCKLWKDLDEPFKTIINNRIENRGQGYTLLRVLKLVQDNSSEFSTSLFELFMSYYGLQENYYCFHVCGINMNVSLEDVLFLTNLPITGRAIIPESNKDPMAFNRVFSLPAGNKLKLTVLKNFCCDLNKNDDDRIKAVLLMIVSCLIVPSGDGQNCKTTYVQFIEKLDEVDSYAWGAAQLAFLYQGLKENHLRNKKVDGFVWLIMVSAYFFLYLFFLSYLCLITF